MIFELGSHLKKLRQEMGLSQAQVAKMLKVSRASLSGYEVGSSMPPIEIVKELAKIYHVSIDYLLGADTKKRVEIDGLTEKDEKTISYLIRRLQEKNEMP